MTSPTSDPVVSGMPYAVADVGGRTPEVLSDFEGATVVTVDGPSGRYVVHGEGSRERDVVRLHEKASDGGKDVRVWRVLQVADGGFVAEAS